MCRVPEGLDAVIQDAALVQDAKGGPITYAFYGFPYNEAQSLH